jgi:hypothetical protein
MFSIGCMVLDVVLMVVEVLHGAVSLVLQWVEDSPMVKKREERKLVTNAEVRIILQETVTQRVLNVMHAESSKDILYISVGLLV